MTAPNPLKDPGLEFKSLLVLVALATILFGAILWPFFGAVCWAVFIAIVFAPMHRRILRNARGRHGIASLASVLLVVLIVILPLSLMAATIVQEASVLVQKMRSGEIQIGTFFQKAVDALPEWLRGILERFGFLDFGTVQQKVLAALQQSSQALTSSVFNIGQNTLDFTLSFFVMLYVLFFMFRDGESLSAAVVRTIPLREEHTQRLVDHFATVVRATVKGNIVVALVQGALGALAFFALGVPGAVLWGAVMALLSLLPAVGAFIVWAPVAAYFFFAGEAGKAIGLTLWGVVAIGLVDNFLRPILVGKDTRMPDYLVLLATLGGIVVFGLNGFVIGPVIAAVFLVSWDMLATARRETLPATAAPVPAPALMHSPAPTAPAALEDKRPGDGETPG